MPTILFSGHDFRFLRPYMTYCAGAPDRAVLVDEHEGHVIRDTARAAALLQKADVVFCEWCLGNASWYSRHKRPDQVLIVRLHHQEMNLPFLDEIAWENVDALIFICPNHLQTLVARYPILKSRARLIYNPIDCARLDQPKLPYAEFNLGMLGMCPKRKAPHRAIEILAKLRQIDSRYCLFIKGRLPQHYPWLWRRPEEREYYTALQHELQNAPYRESVVFEDYDDNVAGWFSRIGFILSVSDHEGSHQAVAEGMAAGSIPVIRNWEGAASMYPTQFIAAEADDAVRLILGMHDARRYAEAQELRRRYARAHFDQTHVIDEFERLLRTLLARRMPQQRAFYAVEA